MNPNDSVSIASTIVEELACRKAGVLVVGHGTRNKSGTQQLLRLTSLIRSRLSGAVVTGCFLELAAPTIEEGIAELKQQGCRSLVVLPVLLFAAAHAKSDIPDAVAESAIEHGLDILGQTESLGTHPLVIDLSTRRYLEVVSFREGIGQESNELGVCPKGGCAWGGSPADRCAVYREGKRDCFLARTLRQESDMGKIGLAMVGRGTSDPLALDHMRALTRLRVERTPVSAVETGFFAGGVPSVDSLLEIAAGWDCQTVIVQPHLLFEGELMEQLRAKVRDYRQKQQDRHWWITRSLGADPELAKVFVGLLGEQVSRW